jgi:DNA (cytosine-5)-methyltransferase 1
MRYGSVCSGIEAATQAWHPLGWTPAFFSEIEKFPSAVLAHHYGSNMPGEEHSGNGVPNHGDMTKFEEWPDHAIDLLVGGTPCQPFSVAGLRKGLDDPRGNLALVYLAIAERYKPRWVVWENVPGVFSSTTDDIPDPCPPDIDLEGGNGPGDGEEIVVEDEHDGQETHALGCFLAGLSELGYGVAYRTLDAQYVRTCEHTGAVPQRRRRVFVVGYLGDWRRAAAVLFDRESLSGNPPPRREAGQKPAPTLSARTQGGGGLGTDFELDGGLTAVCGVPECSPALKARDYKGPSSDGDGDGDGAPILPVAFSSKDYGADAQDEVSATLRAMGHDGSHANAGGQVAVAFNARQDPDSWDGYCGPIDTDGGTQAVAFAENSCAELRLLTAPTGGGRAQERNIATDWAVRRLTPRECERLQGFPDDFTMIPYRGKSADRCPDGPRYKALGNSMAVPCMEWIGQRIEMVEAICAEERAA